MSTNFLDDVRDPVVDQLEAYMGVPLVLFAQEAPRPDYPFIYYSVLTPYSPTGELGVYEWEAGPEDGTVTTTRTEHPSATFSFTACSQNRKTPGGFILGEDEAISIAEKAHGWFLHVGYPALSMQSIVVAQVTNVANRNALMFDEISRRWGFDVRINYPRVDERVDPIIAKFAIIKE